MNIIRHKLSANERRAIENLTGSVDGFKQNRAAGKDSKLKAIHVSRERPDAETGHYLAFKNCQDQLAELADLKRRIDNLTRGPEASSTVIVEQLPDVVEMSSPILLLFGTMLGEIREYPGYSSDFTRDVSDTSKFALGHRNPGSDNNLKFKPHTDLAYYANPAPFLCFLMLSQGVAGGESLVCDPMDVVTSLSPETLKALQRPFKFWSPEGVPGTDTRHFPVLARVSESSFSVRYRREHIAPLEAAQEKALDEWRSAIDEHTLQYTLAPGEMAIYSNTRLLHGRRKFRDGVFGGGARRARRAWVAESPRDPAEEA